MNLRFERFWRHDRIVVCATQRCGSTMVCEDISSTSVMGKPEEYLLRWDPVKKENWQEFFNITKDISRTENGIFGIKLMANQLSKVDACFATFIDPNGARSFPHLIAAMPYALWVWVKRRDTLDQAISHYVAKSRGYFHTIKKQSGFVPGSAVTENGFAAVDKEVPYDFQSIMQELHIINRDNLIWQGFFEKNEIEPFIVEYEDAVTEAGRSAYISLLSQAMDVPVGKLPERNLVKIPNEKNAAIRERFLTDLLDRI